MRLVRRSRSSCDGPRRAPRNPPRPGSRSWHDSIARPTTTRTSTASIATGTGPTSRNAVVVAAWRARSPSDADPGLRTRAVLRGSLLEELQHRPVDEIGLLLDHAVRGARDDPQACMRDRV